MADARFCKPLDGNLIRQLAQEHEILITVEEGSIGGFGSHVSQFFGLNGLLDGKLKWRAMMLPDRYIEHGSQKDQTEAAGLSSRHIATTVLSPSQLSDQYYRELVITFSAFRPICIVINSPLIDDKALQLLI